jgi:hypothetical protein
MTDSHRILRRIFWNGFQADISLLLLGKTFPSDALNSETGEIVWPEGRKITKVCIEKLMKAMPHIEVVHPNAAMDPGIGPRLLEIIAYYRRRFSETKSGSLSKD